MLLEDIHIGDRVVVRDWDDMADEYGLQTSDTSIGIPMCSFLSEMRETCGKEYTVSDLYNGFLVRLVDDTGREAYPGKHYCAEMLRPADEPMKGEDIDEAALFGLLGTC